MSIRVSHAWGRLLRQAVHYLIVCVPVCSSVKTPECLCYAYSLSECVCTGISLWVCECKHVHVFFFRSTWADGYRFVSEIPCTRGALAACGALAFCLQAKSSCCRSGVSCLCSNTKLIFYQLPYPLGRGDLATGWGIGEYVKAGRKPRVGVNNPGLQGKVKEPTQCWILSIIPEGLSAPALLLSSSRWQSAVPPCQSSNHCVTAYGSICQGLELSHSLVSLPWCCFLLHNNWSCSRVIMQLTY